jgi:hypothetical protein
MLKTKYLLLFVLTTLCGGCAHIATSVATQAGVQVIGEQYLISQKKPVIKCNAFNIIKGNKMCRVSMVYNVSHKRRKDNGNTSST